MQNNKLGFEVCEKNLSSALNELMKHDATSIINTINPHSFICQLSDLKFRNALISSDLLVPDGIGYCVCHGLLERRAIKRITGYDVFLEIMKISDSKNWRVMFIGSTENTLGKIGKRCQEEYSGVEIITHSPPFRSSFSEVEISEISSKILSECPDVVFVGLTAPKQEKLIQDLQISGGVRFVCGVGAVFDFYAGTVRRPAKIFQKLGIEWLIRFLNDPKRLFRRNFISAPKFVAHCVVLFVRAWVDDKKKNRPRY